MRALRKWARACGQLNSDDAARLLSDEIFLAADEIEERQSLFEKSKTDLNS